MLEEKHGQVEAVAIEVDNSLIITPIFKKGTATQESESLGDSKIKYVPEKRAPEEHAHG